MFEVGVARCGGLVWRDLRQSAERLPPSQPLTTSPRPSPPLPVETDLLCSIREEIFISFGSFVASDQRHTCCDKLTPSASDGQPPPSAEDLGGEAEASQPPALLPAMSPIHEVLCVVGDRLDLSFRIAHLLPAGAD